MVPCSFDESNLVLSRPESMGADECEALSVLRTQTHSGAPIILSCWKLTTAELAELNRTGRVWLLVYGQTMPPVALTAEKPI